MDNIIGILPCDENTVIVDPFMGSGTTGIACKKLGVDFIGIEIDEKYFSICESRIGGCSISTDAGLGSKNWYGKHSVKLFEVN